MTMLLRPNRRRVPAYAFQSSECRRLTLPEASTISRAYVSLFQALHRASERPALSDFMDLPVKELPGFNVVLKFSVSTLPFVLHTLGQ